MLKSYVNTTNFIKAKAQAEEGEVASWLILAAGLAAAAVLASGELGDIIGALVGEVRTSAGV